MSIPIQAMVTAACLLALSPVLGAESIPVRIPEFSMIPGEKLPAILLTDENGCAETGPFEIERVMNAEVYGQMLEVNAKFRPASVRLAVKDETVQVDFHCPVAADVKYRSTKSPLWGDRAAFFVRPDLASSTVYCYHANANGPWEGRRYVDSVLDESWKSAVKMQVEKCTNYFAVSMTLPLKEVFGGRQPEPGDTVAVAFLRDGATGGAKQSWTLHGSSSARTVVNRRESFGTLVYGGGAAYFARRLGAFEDEAKGFATNALLVAAVEKVFAPVRTAVTEHAAERAAYPALERMFTQLEQSLLTIKLGGTPVIIYESEGIWGNEFAPDIHTKPLEKIVIRTPRNIRVVKPFAIANLGSRPFVGNVKFFDGKCPRVDFSNFRGDYSKKKRIASAFTIRRAVQMYARDQRQIYDPLVDLPGGSMVEIGMGAAVPFYAELDTAGLNPGVYKGCLELFSGTPGVYEETYLNYHAIPFEVTVLDDELGTNDGLRIAYTHTKRGFDYGCSMTNILRQYVKRRYNGVVLSRFKFYPWRDADGKWREPDYGEVDQYVDAWIAAGLDAKTMYLAPFLGVEKEAPKFKDRWWGLRDHQGVRIPFGTPEYDEGALFMIEKLGAHFRERYGLPREHILWYPVDEIGGPAHDAKFESRAARFLHLAKIIRRENPANKLFVNPRTVFVTSGDFEKDKEEFCKYVDIFKPGIRWVTPAMAKEFRDCGIQMIMSYHVSDREVTPDFYRSCPWRNFAFGFTPWVTHWHLEEGGTLRYQNGNAYGTFYLDYDHDTSLLSRRQLGEDIGYEDSRLIIYLRGKFKDDAERLAKIEEIIAHASKTGTMAAMDAAREALVALLAVDKES